MRHFHTGCIATCLLISFCFSGCGKRSTETGEQPLLTAEDQTVQTIRDVELGMSDQPAVMTTPRCSIAVIDVNDIAGRVGMLDDINQRVRQKETEAQARFAALQAKFAQEYAATQQQFGPEPGEQDQAELYALQQRHMQELNTQWHLLQNEAVDLHNELKKDFLDSVRSVALAVAKTKGMTTVLTSSQVFSMDEQCDITADVADLMSKILAASQNPSNSIPSDSIPSDSIPESKQIPEKSVSQTMENLLEKR